MVAILDLAQNEDLPWVDSGGRFFLFLHTSNEFISGEKPLLTFLSNLSRSLFRLVRTYIYFSVVFWIIYIVCLLLDKTCSLLGYIWGIYLYRGAIYIMYRACIGE